MLQSRNPSKAATAFVRTSFFETELRNLLQQGRKLQTGVDRLVSEFSLVRDYCDGPDLIAKVIAEREAPAKQFISNRGGMEVEFRYSSSLQLTR